jgi:formate/nitrite transporter FocA (FNT family)
MRKIKNRHVFELIIVAYVCILIGAFLLALDYDLAAGIILIPGLLTSGAAAVESSKKDLTSTRDRVHL